MMFKLFGAYALLEGLPSDSSTTLADNLQKAGLSSAQLLNLLYCSTVDNRTPCNFDQKHIGEADCKADAHPAR